MNINTKTQKAIELYCQWFDTGTPINIDASDIAYELYSALCELKTEDNRLRSQLQVARDALAEIREVWAGSDGFVAETASEAYQRRLLVRGYEIAVKALAAGQEES